MATLQDDGRIGEAEILLSLPIYVAVGRGLPAWDNAAEPEPTNAISLTDEIGRRLATQVQFVVPAAAGEVETPQGNYTASAVPTKWVHVRMVLGFEDAIGETIRETAVYYGCEPKPGLPAGQRFFTPQQFAKNGRIKLLNHERVKLVRDAGIRETFEYVFPF